MDAAQASLHAVNAELLVVEEQNREKAAKVEEGENEVTLLKKLIEEERMKSEKEINDILVAYRRMEQVIITRQRQFDAKLGLPNFY